MSCLDTYGPKLAENIVQGTARDLLAEAMIRLRQASFNIVMHVHDEVVVEVPLGSSSVTEICNFMAEQPEWAEGLPLRADGYECSFYKRISRREGMKLFIATGNSRREKHWNNTEIELEDLSSRLTNTVRTSETVEQYRKLPKARQDEIKDVGGFVLGKLKGGREKRIV